MRIYGIDFTSAPRSTKPIACASCVLDGDALYVHCLAELVCLESFDNFLASHGPWVAGLDFPFGQPRALVQELGWPLRWEGYVGHGEALGMAGFEEVVAEYCAARAAGQKYRYRRVDGPAGARSPMMLHRVPVGRMFMRGAPRLARSPVCVLPCRPNADERIAVEAYPALIARRLIGRRAYKSDAEDSGERAAARCELVRGLASRSLLEHYGVRVVIEPAIAAELSEQRSGDFLDAVACAVQAAWAWSRREEGFGIPADADPLEGWIVDPLLAGAGTGGPYPSAASSSGMTLNRSPTMP